jgi:peptidoglycan L-alanyl-D-glutamate endopeptidase CwlK
MAVNYMIESIPIDAGIPWMGGLRTAEEQNAIYKEGNSSCDGYKKKSNHQRTDENGKCLAIDIVPYIAGVGYDYNAYGRFGIIGTLMLEAWEELQDEGLIPSDLYLHWGGFWTNKKKGKLGWDMAHFEIRDTPQVLRISS